MMSAQPQITWTHPGLPQILDAIPKNIESLLDVGCGRGIIGALSRIYRGPRRLVGVDGYKPYLEFCNEHRFYDELLDRKLEQLPLPFGDREFQVVTCIEVIEHLRRDSAVALLAELERVGETVIVTTPSQFFEQDELDENPLQQHRSAWSVRDFRERGYQVRGTGGLRILGRHVKFVSAALAPWARMAPGMSDIMLCKRG